MSHSHRRVRVARGLVAAVVAVVAALTTGPAVAHATATACAGPISLAVRGSDGNSTTQRSDKPFTVTVLGAGGVPMASICGGYLLSEDWAEAGGESWTGHYSDETFSGGAPGSLTFTVHSHRPWSDNGTSYNHDDDYGTATVTLTLYELGPSKTALSVSPSPTAGLATQLSGSTTSSYPIATWGWNFGDGTTGTFPDATVSHVYDAPGDYPATVTATDSYGMSDTATGVVHVYAPLIPHIVASASAVNLLTPVHVDGGSSESDAAAPISAYDWRFGDGATAAGPTAGHLYATTGTYTIVERITDSLGRTASSNQVVTVTDQSGGPTAPAGVPPTAFWTTTTPTPTAASPTAFDGSASSDADGSVTGYAWTFGDGGSSTRVDPQHTYAEPGIYPVTLNVVDDDGLTSHLTKTITVADAPPRAGFTAIPQALTAGRITTFDGTGSTDLDGTLEQYAWNFGDGTTGSGPSISHSYVHAGSYDVTLTVTDDAGGTDSVTRPVAVTQAAPVAELVLPPVPVAGTPAAFDGGPSSDPDGTVQQYAWDFGDGTSGTGQTPTHPYAHAGSYVVTLTVTDDDGLHGTTSRTLAVAPAAPSAAFTAPAASAGTAATFDGTPSSDVDGTLTGYHWDFGDGTAGDGATPPHQYGIAGSYPVTLTVTDDAGLTGSVTHLVTVSPAVATTPGLPATDLAVSVAGRAPKAGQYAYTVTVKNLGHTAAQGVVLLDTPDSAQTLVAVSAPAALHCSGVPVGATGTITCKSGTATLAAGMSWVVTVTVRQPAALRTVRTLVDTAQVRAANPDGVTRNNSARLTTTLAAVR